MKVGIRAIPYNYALRKARRSAKLTQAQLAEQAEMSQSAYSAIERLAQNATEDQAIRISLALGQNLDELFPPQALRETVESFDFAVEVESLDALPAGDAGLLIDGPDVEMEHRAMLEAVREAVCRLHSREKEVITYHFGLGGNRPMTLGEIGRLYGVTGNRIRQIENRAMRHLRHPIQSRALREFR